MVIPAESSDPSVVLVVPADARFLQVLRTLTAGVASMLDIPYDTLDDQRIAVAEAANLLLALSPGSATLTLRLWPRQDELIVSLEASDAAVANGNPDPTTGFSWNIIQHLADGVERTELDGRPAVTMRWTTLSHRPA